MKDRAGSQTPKAGCCCRNIPGSCLPPGVASYQTEAPSERSKQKKTQKIALHGLLHMPHPPTHPSSSSHSPLKDNQVCAKVLYGKSQPKICFPIREGGAPFSRTLISIVELIDPTYITLSLSIYSSLYLSTRRNTMAAVASSGGRLAAKNGIFSLSTCDEDFCESKMSPFGAMASSNAPAFALLDALTCALTSVCEHFPFADFALELAHDEDDFSLGSSKDIFMHEGEAEVSPTMFLRKQRHIWRGSPASLTAPLPPIADEQP
jgi:hypothetical protein